MTRQQLFWRLVSDLAIMVVAAVVLIGMVSVLWNANPAGKAAQLKADKKAALESLCTQNDGVPEWWEGQFVCIQKKGE